MGLRGADLRGISLRRNFKRSIYVIIRTGSADSGIEKPNLRYLEASLRTLLLGGV
jgi:hypothetical protein